MTITRITFYFTTSTHSFCNNTHNSWAYTTSKRFKFRHQFWLEMTSGFITISTNIDTISLNFVFSWIFFTINHFVDVSFVRCENSYDWHEKFICEIYIMKQRVDSKRLRTDTKRENYKLKIDERENFKIQEETTLQRTAAAVPPFRWWCWVAYDCFFILWII